MFTFNIKCILCLNVTSVPAIKLMCDCWINYTIFLIELDFNTKNSADFSQMILLLQWRKSRRLLNCTDYWYSVADVTYYDRSFRRHQVESLRYSYRGNLPLCWYMFGYSHGTRLYTRLHLSSDITAINTFFFLFMFDDF